ncbi:MAG TPA: hypothetical protein VFD84_07880 [Candidatus Binatia bacterium]|nr:hypothetical protein [Candidatus Binatia bacterium]
MGALPAWALHLESPPAIMVTAVGAHAISTGRSWDRNLVFSSTEDLLGNGSTGRQIFLFQLTEYDCEQGTTLQGTVCPQPPWHPLIQVTQGPGDPDNPSVGINNNQDTRPAVVAFDAFGSYGNLAGCSLACQQHRQIFTYNLVTHVLSRITSSTDGDNTHPSVSKFGTVIVFESTANPSKNPVTARVGAPGVPQVFLYDKRSDFIAQLGGGATAATSASVNRDGGFFAFSSTSDVACMPGMPQGTCSLTGDGHDTGIRQIYAGTWDHFSGITSFFKVTNGNADSSHPLVAEQDPVVLFDSAATDLAGDNVDHTPGVHVFSARLDEGSTPPVTQYTFTQDGNCTWPTADPNLNHISFICTGDPYQNGTIGNRVFTLEKACTGDDRKTCNSDTECAQANAGTCDGRILGQMTGRGDVQGPLTGNIGNFFLAFATTEDLANAETCGRQIAIIDFYSTFPIGHGSGRWGGATAVGQLPPDMSSSGGVETSAIGRRQFTWKPGGGNAGSRLTLTTRDTSSTGPIRGVGRFTLNIGAPDPITGDASVQIPAAGTAFPALEIPGVGALCLSPAADGAGVLDCDGGDAGGDVLVRQDHNTDASDPLCLLGCREGDDCQGGLPGPHQALCPKCVAGLCDSGFNIGQACSSDLQCQPLTTPKCVDGFCVDSATDGKACTSSSQCTPVTQCKGNKLGICNGPVTLTASGTYQPGGMTANVPIDMELALDPGIDGFYCTKDDPPHAIKDIHATLHLTTGRVTGTITDGDDIIQPSEQIAAALSGAPFDCNDLRNHKMDGALLAGEILQLDLPNIAGPTANGLRDVIIGLRLAPESAEIGTCACTSNSDCDDGNWCSGPGECRNHTCVRTPPSCDDGNPCTEDTCDPVNHCQHAPLLDGTSCDDGNPCNGVETCQSQACTPGTPLGDGTSCSDGNPCNGDETCQQGACVAGPAPADGADCFDGNPCNGKEACQNEACVPVPPVSPDCNGHNPSSAYDDCNPCTLDTCDAVSGPRHDAILNGTPCGSGDVCAGAPICMFGNCIPGTPLPEGQPCSNGDACYPDGGTCHNQVCLTGPQRDCDDHNPCTLDSCDAALGCVHDPLEDGVACSPASGGTNTGTCQQGICRAPNAKECDDANPCTTDAKDPVAGCVHTTLADGTPCANSTVKNACKAINTCLAGVCTAGSPPSCNDQNPCTQDKCDPALGCLHTTLGDLPGVTCQLNAIKTALKKAPSSKFHRPRLRAQLVKMVDAARKRLNTASNVDGKPHAIALRSANRQLSKLLKQLLKAGLHNKLDAGFADELIGMARGTQTMLQPFLN